jgi:hypothetical protein
MNARTGFPELDRIRRDIGARLRIEHEVAEPPPQLLMALLKELEIHEHDVEGQRLFAQVEARADELLRAAGRKPGDAHGELPRRRYRLDRPRAARRAPMHFQIIRTRQATFATSSTPRTRAR